VDPCLAPGERSNEKGEYSTRTTCPLFIFSAARTSLAGEPETGARRGPCGPSFRPSATLKRMERTIKMTAGSIAHQLRGRKQPSGWVARCPAHDDHNPSLSLKDGRDGRILVHCHAGCEQGAVIDALIALGMWPEKPQRKSVVVETYEYTDQSGTLLYQVCRTEPKDFFQRRPDGYGGGSIGSHKDRCFIGSQRYWKRQ
jgi:hypothetical protein